MALLRALRFVVALPVMVGGFLYLLAFGSRKLSPSVHADLDPERLRLLLRSAFEYGLEGVTVEIRARASPYALCYSKYGAPHEPGGFRVAIDDGTFPSPHYEQLRSALNRSGIAWREDSAPTEAASRILRIDLGSSVESAAQLAELFFGSVLSINLETSCELSAVGVGLWKVHAAQ